MSPLAEPVRHAGPVPPEVASELGGGERLLWSGQPLPGLRLQRADLLLVPFSLFWCGFVFFALASALRTCPPPHLLVILLVFVAAQERGSGAGTISFGSGGLGARFGVIEGWPDAERSLPPRFRLLPEARRVHEVIRTAQRLVRPA